MADTPKNIVKSPPKVKDASKAHPGNRHAERYNTPELRADLKTKLVAHLLEGLDQKTFGPCDWDTVERYCREYPDEFPVIEINEALRIGKQWHEKNLRDIASGRNPDGNPAAAIFLAKNKLGMRDRIDVREVPQSNFNEASDEELDEIIKNSQAEIDGRKKR